MCDPVGAVYKLCNAKGEGGRGRGESATVVLNVPHRRQKALHGERWWQKITKLRVMLLGLPLANKMSVGFAI